jgi:hypothetical protein
LQSIVDMFVWIWESLCFAAETVANAIVGLVKAIIALVQYIINAIIVTVKFVIDVVVSVIQFLVEVIVMLWNAFTTVWLWLWPWGQIMVTTATLIWIQYRDAKKIDDDTVEEWHLDRAQSYCERGPKARKGWPPPPPNSLRRDKDEWPDYVPLLSNRQVWASLSAEAGSCVAHLVPSAAPSAAAPSPAAATSNTYTPGVTKVQLENGGIGNKLRNVSPRGEQDAPVASPRRSMPPRRQPRTASKSAMALAEEGRSPSSGQDAEEFKPACATVPRVRIPKPPNPEQMLQKLQRNPVLIQQQMVSQMPVRDQDVDEEAAHPLLVAGRDAPPQSRGVLFYELQKLWQWGTSVVNNVFERIDDPEYESKQEEMRIEMRRWSPIGAMLRSAIETWKAWRTYRSGWKARMNSAFANAEAAPFLKRRQAYKEAYARLTLLWELEMTMMPLDVEAMQQKLLNLTEPLADPIIDQARGILMNIERQKKLKRQAASASRSCGATSTSGARGAQSPDQGVVPQAATSQAEAERLHAREAAAAEQALKDEEMRLAKVAEAKAAAFKAREAKAAKAEAMRAAAAAKAEANATARAASRAAQAEKAAAERAAKEDADAVWADALQRKKEVAAAKKEAEAEARRGASAAAADQEASTIVAGVESTQSTQKKPALSSRMMGGVTKAMDSIGELARPRTAHRPATPQQTPKKSQLQTAEQGERIPPRPSGPGQPSCAQLNGSAEQAPPLDSEHGAAGGSWMTSAPIGRPKAPPKDGVKTSSRLACLSASRGASGGFGSLPPECSQPAPWKGADRRWAKFMKAAAKRVGEMPPESRQGSPRLAIAEIKRKPLFPQQWEQLPRAISTTALVLRESAELDSEAIGNVSSGAELFVKERRPPGPDGSVRMLVTDTPVVGKDALGWVTGIKDGVDLVAYITNESAMPTIDGATGFFTSIIRPAAAPLPDRSPEGSPRTDREGRLAYSSSARSVRSNDGKLSPRSLLLHRPWPDVEH